MFVESPKECSRCGQKFVQVGQFQDLRAPLPITLAARSNLVPLTAIGYELWRRQALTLLSGRRFPLSEEFQLMISYVQVEPSSVILDLGTSTGLYARALLEAGAQTVYGLDFSPYMLAQAVKKAKNQTGFIPLLARAEAIPLPASSVDAVVVGGSWNEFPNPEAVVGEMYRVLKPQGRVWIMFSCRSGSFVQLLFEKAGLRFPTVEAVQAMLAQKGFETKGWQEKTAGFVIGTKVL